MEDTIIDAGAGSTGAVEGTPQKFIIGISLSHIYGIEIEAIDEDVALLKMDDWLRGRIPASALSPEIRTSDLNVIGMGVLDAAGKIQEADSISDMARAELNARGALPEMGCVHLFPNPPVVAPEMIDLLSVDVRSPGH